jgi:hypothetical protein
MKMIIFRHIFCNAYHKGVYGNKYQWLIVGMYDENWYHRRHKTFLRRHQRRG